MNKNIPIQPAVTDIILESIADGVFTVDVDWRITSFNRAAEEITGIRRQDAIGRFCWEVFRSNMCERSCALKQTMIQEKSFSSASTFIVTADKKKLPITLTTSVLRDNEGCVIGGVEIFRDHSLVEELRRELSGSYRAGDMISRSESMRKLFGVLDKIGQSDSTILIQGETGTGKELLARAIHHASLRKEAPFIAVNCGALPDSLLESELFGHAAGAFTDARTAKQGLFAAAETGTLFLDEIGETTPAFQVKLLRVLEERMFLPLGSVTPQRSDARIIAASNRDLEEMVGDKAFRQDLFYRINVMALKLPPLRERKEDIPLLIEHCIARLNRHKGQSIRGVSAEVMDILMKHDFPGNIRELENIIEHGFILCKEGDLKPEHLPVRLCEQESIAVPHTLAEAERAIIGKALDECGRNVSAAAAALGMHRATLYRKIKKLGISPLSRPGQNDV